MSSLLRSSKFIRYFAVAARNLVVSTRSSVDSGRFHQFASPTAPYLRSLATQVSSATSQFSSNLERSLFQLDQDVRRTGRISRKELEEVLDEFKQSKNATSSQSLLLIRCCGNLVPDELPEVRTKLVKEIWATLVKLKIPMDISHYNALLRVYLENEHNFSPAEFLQDLETKGVEPNRVTYQRLITRYCQQGDIEGATRILEFMRQKGLPVNESVFNALILGHSQAGDMESATGILTVMKQAGLEPSSDTYTTLLIGHAKLGDMEKIHKILVDCDKSEIYLLDKDHLDVVFALATNGKASEVDAILNRIRRSAGFNQDAVSLILRLVNQGQEEVALKVLRLMPIPQRDESVGGPANQGNFFIRQLVKAQRPVESILSLCKTLESEGLNNKALYVATEASLEHGSKDTAMRLLKILQETGAPIRQHYFWPLFCLSGRSKDDESIASILKDMTAIFGLTPSGETVREFVLPYLTIRDKDQIVGFLKRAGVSSGVSAVSLVFDYLTNGNIQEAADVVSKYRAFYSPPLLRRPLTSAFLKTGATEHYLNIIHHICEGMDRHTFQGEDPEGGLMEKREVVGFLLLDLLHSSRNSSLDLKPLLEGLFERGLGITNRAAEQLETKMSGERLTNEISELLTKLTAQDLQVGPATRSRIPNSAFNTDEESLKERIGKLEGAGHSAGVIKMNLLGVHCKNQEIDKALEVLQSMGNDAGAGAYAYVIDAMTAAGRLDDALDFFQKLRAASPNASLNPLKLVRLVEALIKQGRAQDGIRLLEENEVDRKFDELPFSIKSSVFQTLNSLAEKGDFANLEKLFDLVVKKNYVEVTNVLLGPLVKVHLLKNDIEGAVKKFEECVEKYKMTPWKNELTRKLIEAEDAALLQRVTDLSSKVHGEVNSLYDLVFAFVECGRIRQARKILETPGLRSRQQRRLISVCERYQQEGSITALEGLAEATKDMTHIDRSEIFDQLLTSHIKKNDTDKALGLWTQMQEEDVQPSDSFLFKLATFLESRGLAAPFIKPKQDEKPAELKQDKPAERTERTGMPTSTALISFKNALKSNDWANVRTIKQQLDNNGVKIPPSDLSLFMEGLCQNNQLGEAYNVAMSILKSGNKIVLKHFRFLTNKLATAGDVDKLKKLGDLINSALKKELSYDNKLCAAYLNAGRASELMDDLLAEAEKATSSDALRLEEKFPRGGLGGIAEAHPELVPKFQQIAEKYKNIGCRVPGNVLWASLFLLPDMESRADKLWDQFELALEPRLMFRRIIKQAKAKLDLTIVDRLLARLKESKVTESGLGVVHSCSIDILVDQGLPEKALERVKTILQDVSLENINRSSLQKLKKALEAKGTSFPYTIPNKGSVPVLAFIPGPYMANFAELQTKEISEAADFFTTMVGFDGSWLRKPSETNWQRFLRDDSGILSKSSFNRRCILRVVSVDDQDDKKKGQSSSSSSSDDEAEEHGARK